MFRFVMIGRTMVNPNQVVSVGPALDGDEDKINVTLTNGGMIPLPIYNSDKTKRIEVNDIAYIVGALEAGLRNPDHNDD